MSTQDAEFEAAFKAHRPAVLRHCYRMLGSFAEAEELTQDSLERAWAARDSFRGSAPLSHWLFRIATNGCLNALAQRKRRGLPQHESTPASSYEFGASDAERWLTPAPDAALFPHGLEPEDPERLTEAKQHVALAFLALLQNLPPKQRAALLLRDVLGWSAEETADALDQSVSAVNSSLRRARSVAKLAQIAEEPAPATLKAFVEAWEARDLDALTALLKRDVELAMPPYPVWFQGLDAVTGFFKSSRFSAFWSSLVRVEPTRSNGFRAFVFQLQGEPLRPHSVMLVRFEAERVAEMVTFVGEAYFEPFCR